MANKPTVIIPDWAIKQIEQQLGAITKVYGRNAVLLAQRRISDALDKYTPMKTGMMRNQKSVALNNTPDGIRYTASYYAPYAGYQYNNPGGRFKNYTTPGTGDNWDVKAFDEITQIIYEELIKQFQQNR